MHVPDRKPLYRHIDVALLRAAGAPLSTASDPWPDLIDIKACREWLDQTWSRPDLADAVRQASPALGERVDALRAGHTVEDRQIRSATLSTARYLLRSIGRPTPFGLFAGVAPVTLGKTAQAHWGEGHQAVARVRTEWLADIIARAEGCPELLERLHVVVTDLAIRRGGRLEMPQGPNRVTIRYAGAVAAVRDAAETPVRFGALIDKLAKEFTVDRSTVRDMLTQLVHQGYLITNLRAPFTVTDLLAHLVDRLHDAEADTVAAVGSLVRELEAIQAGLRHHNHETTTRAEQSCIRETIMRRMRELSPAGRTPLAVDLLLDCDVRLPPRLFRKWSWPQARCCASRGSRPVKRPGGITMPRSPIGTAQARWCRSPTCLTRTLVWDTRLGIAGACCPRRRRVFRSVTSGLSFGPLYPHAANVCRVPAYLEHVLPLGEHRELGDDTLLTVDDLAIIATRDRLHLVSISRRRVVEPQVFHALALDKQAPPLARFLAYLPGAFSAAWYQFDWGPYVRLPFRPRVRYRRTILSPAQWRLAAGAVSLGQAGHGEWRQVLGRWRKRWECPDVVELRDADRTLRLALDEPAHATLLHSHLVRHGQAILSEAIPAAEFGWIDGHAHEVALPLVTTRTTAPNPLRGCLPVVTNTHGHLPGSPEAPWLSAKIHTHPERMNEIIAEHLPTLLAALDTEPSWWFVRYHSPQETDHIRLRIRADREYYAACAVAVGKWAQRLRQAGMVGRLVHDTYYPEIGRYGHGAALDAAEDVFAADSHIVATALRNLPATAVHPTALAVATSRLAGDSPWPPEPPGWLCCTSPMPAPASQDGTTLTGGPPR